MTLKNNCTGTVLNVIGTGTGTLCTIYPVPFLLQVLIGKK